VLKFDIIVHGDSAQNGLPSESAAVAAVPDAADAEAWNEAAPPRREVQRKKPWWELPGVRQEAR
jgi:hypothetical protein